MNEEKAKSSFNNIHGFNLGMTYFKHCTIFEDIQNLTFKKQSKIFSAVNKCQRNKNKKKEPM